MNKLKDVASDIWSWVREHPDKVAKFAYDHPIATTVMVVAVVAAGATAVVAVFA